MPLPEIPKHYAAGAAAAVLVGVAAVLLAADPFARLGGDLASRYAAAQARVTLADGVAFFAVSALLLGAGIGLVLGGMWAYHTEVSTR